MSITESVKLFYPILLGLFLAYIAYQQHITNRNKLRLDLYNKRFEVYKDTLRFYQELVDGELLKETHLSFIASKNASYHLFANDREVFSLLDKIHSESFKITGFKNLGNEMDGVPEAKHEMYEASLSVISWLNKTMPELRDMMSKHLDQRTL